MMRPAPPNPGLPGALAGKRFSLEVGDGRKGPRPAQCGRGSGRWLRGPN
jgi:hypothetical protein